MEHVLAGLVLFGLWLALTVGGVAILVVIAFVWKGRQPTDNFIVAIVVAGVLVTCLLCGFWLEIA